MSDNTTPELPNDFEELVESLKDRPLIEDLRILRKLNKPTLLLGPPGVGKSAMVYQLVNEGEWYDDIRLSTMDPVDVRGYPTIKRRLDELLNRIQTVSSYRDLTSDDALRAKMDVELQQLFAEHSKLFYNPEAGAQVQQARPEFLPPLDWDGRGILMFDELNTASVNLMNTVLQLFGPVYGRGRRIGPHLVQDGLWLVAAGNRKFDIANVNVLSAPLRDRFEILEVEFNLKQWTNWAMNNGVHPAVVAYLNARSHMAYKPPQSEYEPFPSPRSWSEKVSEYMKEGVTSPRLFRGAVGESAAADFMGFLEYRSLMPNIDKLLNGKETFDFKSAKADIQFAIMVEMAYRCIADPKLISKAIKVAGQARPEYAAVFITPLLESKDYSIRGAFVQNKDVQQWVKDHHLIIKMS